MSTLNVENISDGTSTITIIGTSKGTAKAYVNWNATDNILNSSYGVSSVVDLSGNYTEITFTTSFANTNYIAVAGPLPIPPGNNPFVLQELNTTGSPRSASKYVCYANSAGSVPVILPATIQLAFYSA